MYCSNCGASLPNGAKFCQSCGTQVVLISKNVESPEQYLNSKMENVTQGESKYQKSKGKLMAVAIVAVVGIICTGVLGYIGLRQFLFHSNNSHELPQKASAGAITGDSPEEIVEIFMDAFAEQDIETMLACCYLDEMVERYSFIDAIDLSHFYVPQSVFFGDGQFYKELALYEQKGELAQNIRYLTWSIVLAEDGKDVNIIRGDVDRDWAIEFENKVDSEKIHGFKVLRIDENNPEKQYMDQHIANLQQRSKIYGVDDICERTVLFECNGMLFYKGFTLVQYDGKWQILSFIAVFTGESTYGTASRIESVDSYLEIIE